jgi:hypothetical protein
MPIQKFYAEGNGHCEDFAVFAGTPVEVDGAAQRGAM